MKSYYRVSIEEAAQLLGLSKQALRVRLQNGRYDFGESDKSGGRNDYYILRHKLYEFLGIPWDSETATKGLKQ